MLRMSKWKRLKRNHKCANDRHNHSHKKIIDHFLMIMNDVFGYDYVALKIPVPTQIIRNLRL